MYDQRMSDDGEVCDLTSKTCTPCRGGVPPMERGEVERHLEEVPAWTLKEGPDRIERTFKTKDYAEAFEIVRKVSEIAEAEGHHPDVSFGWGYATVVLYTHKIKGLHENDFIMAAKIDAAN